MGIFSVHRNDSNLPLEQIVRGRDLSDYQHCLVAWSGTPAHEEAYLLDIAVVAILSDLAQQPEGRVLSLAESLILNA